MKYYIGRVVIKDHGSNREYSSDACIAAETEAQARVLLDERASFWGGDDSRSDSNGGYAYSESAGQGFTVFAYSVTEISPVSFAEMGKLLPVFGDFAKGDLKEQSASEQAKTLARRIGRQLLKLDVKVSHGKLLNAITASLGETDWQQLKHKASSQPESSAVGGQTQLAMQAQEVVEAAVEWYGASQKSEPAHRLEMAVLHWKQLQESARESSSTPYLPKGAYKGRLRDAKTIEFSARVDAVWLAEGDVRLAAKLLRADPESLMGSFVDALDADTAFCGRHPEWLPEHSMSRDFGAKADEGRDFRIEVEARGSYRQVKGYVGSKDVVVLSNTIAGVWGVGASSCLPYDTHEARKYLACYEATFRKVFELMHEMPLQLIQKSS